MRINVVFSVMVLVGMAISLHAFASERDSVCVGIAERAAAFIQEKGEDYALKVFSASRGPFIEKDLYVFALSLDNKMLAHPYRRDLLGRDLTDIKDVKGKAFVKDFQKTAQQNGSGWVDYWWTKPGEQGEFPKVTYIRRIPERNMYVGVGYYK
jgi:cytochrome c